MAARRAVRSTRRDDEDERVEEPEDELAEEPEDEEPEDELAEEPEDDEPEEPEDELAEEPEDGEPEEPGNRRARGRSRRDGGLSAAKAGQLAMRQIAELTGKQTEGITGVESGEGAWIVGVEVVEDRRIPSSTDILATYETEIDYDGELMSYRRVKRYSRGHGDSESL
jgi:gas vesicle protein GvpO